MFNNQVQELHRLYAVQKLLVKGDPKYPRCELFPMKRTFTESHSVGSSQLIFDQDFGSGFQQRHLDLRLSTGNSCDDDVLDCEELNLSLSIGLSSNKRIKSSRKALNNTMIYPSSPVIIDLEDSTESRSDDFLKAKLHQDKLKMNGDMHQECSYLNQGSSSWHDIRRTVISDLDLNKDQPDGSCGNSSSQVATSLTFKGQTKTCTIDLESLPEPSSDVTEEEVTTNNISEQAVETAVLSLISISKQQTSFINQDSETKSVSDETENRNENKKKTITRSLSIDSYESLVLKLEESSIEEDSATSKTYEVKEVDQKESVIKLRRGSRLKDFKKDILPTLASLSKHEIWEDIKLLEGVIRSREYKRLNKEKAGKGDDRLTQVRSKRAKVNSSGQKSLQKRKW